MALYSIDVGIVSRKRGSNILRHVAYRAAERIHDHSSKRAFDYTSKTDVAHREIVTPPGAPEWMRDREQLWNAAQSCEKLSNARLAQDVFVAIPRGVAPQHRAALIREFVEETFVQRGMVADFAIHNPTASDGQEFPHAHITLTTRQIEDTPQGFGKKLPNWSHPNRIWDIRAKWERHVNRSLERSGTLDRADRRSRRERRREVEAWLAKAIAQRDRPRAKYLAELAADLERPPMPNMGRAAVNMEKRGTRTWAGDAVRKWQALWTVERMQARRRQRVREANRAMQRVAIQELISRTKVRWVNRFDQLLHPTRPAARRRDHEPRKPFTPSHLPVHRDEPVSHERGQARAVVERLIGERRHEHAPGDAGYANPELRQRLEQLLSGAYMSRKSPTRGRQREQLERTLTRRGPARPAASPHSMHRAADTEHDR